MITYDEPKRQTNLVKHGIDLADCEPAFDAPLLTEEDSREAYGEQRLKSFGESLSVTAQHVNQASSTECL